MIKYGYTKMKNENYKKLLEKRRREYKNCSSIFCPCIKEGINFNSEGFNHLQFKTNGTPRKQAERIYKLNLLPLAILTIKLADKVEKYSHKKLIIKKKGNRTKKDIQYWAISALIDKKRGRIKVILRKVGSGKIHFWSIMKI